MKFFRLPFVTLIFLFTQNSMAGWMAKADFSSCPRKYITQTSGQEGPFASESACQSRVNQVREQLACARYSCVEETTGAASASGSAAPGHQMDQSIQNALSAGMQGKISAGDTMGLVSLGLLGNAILAPSTPLTPEQQAAQAEAQRQAQIKAAIAAEQARQEEERYQNDQNEKAFEFLNRVSAASPPPPRPQPNPPPGQVFRSRIACKGGEPGLHTCYVLVCGGAWGGDPVCCPEGFPKLNECDCNCYPANADFECSRYAACQYSYKLPDAK